MAEADQVGSFSSHLDICVEEDDYDLIYGAESGLVEATTHCDHLASLSSDLAHISTPDSPCNRSSKLVFTRSRCQHPSENWLCLYCKKVLCSRFVNKHMLEHYKQAAHCVALSYSDLSVCFACDSYLDAEVIQQLRPVHETAYMLKFGEAPPFQTVESSQMKIKMPRMRHPAV